MWNFQDAFETLNRSFINAFSLCMTVTLIKESFLVKYSCVKQKEFLWSQYIEYWQTIKDICNNYCLFMPPSPPKKIFRVRNSGLRFGVKQGKKKYSDFCYFSLLYVSSRLLMETFTVNLICVPHNQNSW